MAEQVNACFSLTYSVLALLSGLPVPQSNHASIMVRFAAECLDKMKEVVSELNQELHTIDLQIRIGIHSGPCTAGVLRGQKARFQLFGKQNGECLFLS